MALLITKKWFQSFRSKIEKHIKSNGKPLANSTINDYLNVTMVFANKAFKEFELSKRTSDFKDKVEFLPENPKQKLALNLAELELIWNAKLEDEYDRYARTLLVSKNGLKPRTLVRKFNLVPL